MRSKNSAPCRRDTVRLHPGPRAASTGSIAGIESATGGTPARDLLLSLTKGGQVTAPLLATAPMTGELA